MSQKALRYVLMATALFALVVVMVGAYTRLTDAGLGCPDWPGCYGNWVMPAKHHDLASAQLRYRDNPIELIKAWTEMAHRYLAGCLGSLILLCAGGIAWRARKKAHSLPKLVLFLLALLVFQALLGMWTVTLKLLPLVVMGHLLGGMTIVASLSRLAYDSAYDWRSPVQQAPYWLYGLVVLLYIQIALGAWVSANYAGIACVGFPQCNGQWWPHLELGKAFNVFSPIGANYQGGLADSELRITMQWVHRLGAVVVAICLGSVAIGQIRRGIFSKMWAMVLVLLALQWALGFINVWYLLPLPAAVLHNGIAAVLLASLWVMLGRYAREKTPAYIK